MTVMDTRKLIEYHKQFYIENNGEKYYYDIMFEVIYLFAILYFI